jgi:hypothetical protein
MPLVRPMKQGQWEVRSSLSSNRIARTKTKQSGHGQAHEHQPQPVGSIIEYRRRERDIDNTATGSRDYRAEGETGVGLRVAATPQRELRLKAFLT